MGMLIGDATVSVRSSDGVVERVASGVDRIGHGVKKEYNHYIKDIEPGTYILEISRPGSILERLVVDMPDTGRYLECMLHAKDSEYGYRAGRSAGYCTGALEVAVMHAGRVEDCDLRGTREVAESFGLHLSGIFKNADGVTQVFSPGADGCNENERDILKKCSDALHTAGIYSHIGIVLERNEGAIHVATGIILAKCLPGIDVQYVRDTIERASLEIVYEHSPVSRLFEIAVNDVAGKNIVDSCRTLMESGVFESADPMATVTAELLSGSQVIPSDFLFPLQWHLATANVPEAWAILQSHGRPSTEVNDLTYGSADVVIAIVDTGVDSSKYEDEPDGEGAPNHTDFIGNVRGGLLAPLIGSKKVYKIYDMRTFKRTDNHGNRDPNIRGGMYPDNYKVTLSHGVSCAAIATAMANGRGSVGVAPNARLISIRTAQQGTNLNQINRNTWSWLVGLDPGWTTNGPVYDPYDILPAQFGTPGNPGPGADIISNSMRFKYLAENFDADMRNISDVCWYGRQRRGAIFVLGAGNDDSSIMDRQMFGYHRRIIVVAASTLDSKGVEIRAPYSSYGDNSREVYPPKDNSGNNEGSEVEKKKEIPDRKPDWLYVDVSAPSANYPECDNNPLYAELTINEDGSVGPPDDTYKVFGPRPHMVNRPPYNRAIVTAGMFEDTRDFLLGGTLYPPTDESARVSQLTRSNLPGDHIRETTLWEAVDAPVSNATRVKVVKVANVPGITYAPHDAVVIGKVGYNENGVDETAINEVESSVVVGVTEYPDYTELELDGYLWNAHAAGAPVYTGKRSYVDHFSGTSMSTPLVAGTAALILSANPYLTNIEVREILRSTAVKIDMHGGMWLSTQFRSQRDKTILSRDRVAPAIGVQPPIFKPITSSLGIAIDAVADSGKFSRITIAENQSRAGFSVGQAVLIGAETLLVRAATLPPNPIQPVTITVESTDGFHPGQIIRIGDADTTYFAGFPVRRNDGSDDSMDQSTEEPEARGRIIGLDRKKILVGNTRTYQAGQAILIGGVRYVIEFVQGTFKLLLTTEYAGENHWPHVPRMEVVPADVLEGTVEEIVSDTQMTVIYTGPGKSFTTTPKPLVRVKGTESSVIMDLPGDDARAVIVQRLGNVHTEADKKMVLGGRTPYYSRHLGFGRVDAAAAVSAAFSYSHNDRDLMVRKYMGDNGTTRPDMAYEALKLSPDIWLSNSGDSVLPADDAYGTPAPHQTFASNQPRWIYVRVKNRGTKPSLEASVRFYVAVRDRAEILKFTMDDFQQSRIDGVPFTVSSGNIGTQYVEEAYLFPFDATDMSGIPHNRTMVVRTNKWELANLPLDAVLSGRKRIFVLAEITPHDGRVKGADNNYIDTIYNKENFLDIRNDNNVAFREVIFADVQVKGQPDGEPLQKQYPAPRSGRKKSQLFRIDLLDRVGAFVAENVVVEVTGVCAGLSSAVEFYHTSGTGWRTSDPGADWISFDGPPMTTHPATTTPSNPVSIPEAAVGDLYEMFFTGTFAVDTTWQSISIIAVIHDDEGRELGRSGWAAQIVEEPVRYDVLADAAVARPALSAFADMSLLDEQISESMAYGPQSSLVFRSTNSFTSQADSVPAYAAADGVAMIQRMVDPETGLVDEQRVNLIIAPRGGSGVAIQPVQYFVYRGLRIGDFLGGPATGNGGVDYIQVRSGPADENDTSVSAFIREIYRGMEMRRQEMVAAGIPSGDIPDIENDPLSSSILGWEASASLESTNDLPLDDFFNRFDELRQLPLVRRGMHLGDFHAGEEAEFGIDIALQGDYAVPLTFAYARRAYHEINLLEDEPASEWEERRRREDARNFIDAAAYYGMHGSIGVYDHQGRLRRGEELYNDLLLPFLNRNRVYIDIRNEAGYSMNYSGNYMMDGAQVKVGSDLALMYADIYATDGWPIGMIERSHSEILSGEDGIFYLSLAVADNTLPLLYVEQGIVQGQLHQGFVPGSWLLAQGTEWTFPVGFRLPQVEEGGQMRDLAGMIRLRYLRQIPAVPGLAVGNVVAAEHYTDNIFGPVDAGVAWDAAPGNSPMNHLQQTRWDRLHERRYADGRQTGHGISFGALMERGIAVRSGQVLFYNVAVDFYSISGGVVPKGRGAGVGFGPQQNFLEASSIFNGYNVETSEIAQPVAATLYRLVPQDDNVVREGVMMLGITASERALLADAAAVVLSRYHERNLVLEERQIVGAEASVYSLKVRGLHKDTHQSYDAEPTSEIHVYSRDGLFFVSAEFTMPDFLPDIYLPNAEELRAATPEPTAILENHPVMAMLIAGFEHALSSIPDNDMARESLKAAIDIYGEDLWAEATAFTLDGGADDRILYWARLRMAAVLKGHPRLLKNSQEQAEVVRYFEETTRGFAQATFANATTGAMKILLVGFDPYALGGAGVTNSNSGGMVALGMHGKSITEGDATGHINSVILPIRYRDFDDGMVERLFSPFLYGNTTVDMIVAVNMNGGHGMFSLARFAARARTGGFPDNADRKSVGAIGAGTGWNEFYQTSLPVQEMMQGEIGRTPQQIFFYDQSYRLIDPTGVPLEHGRAGIDAGAINSDLNESLPLGGTAVAGSAGSYLPNEFFYRLARLRAQPPGTEPSPNVRLGYLGIPSVNVSAVTGGVLSRSQIMNELEEALKRALAGLGEG